ncbi:TetR/AcrR family transcriptional regulator [Streptomyces triticagri]|uniref:TetR/AcrR family transcriptional regulator n=1 Tax=Streptomyces triticagri TaxID=2293568 RepID=A0A372M0M1_9ACTN|nr:TetR/AcrR family transcriptional regulator [Streptomyces triticagri]RFU84448.1 TetR/AcrR family transcriptional regulator [Streptomyces triticagri]
MVSSRGQSLPAQQAAVHASKASASTPSRRRGAVLKRAILDAALQQLSVVGWNALTMEGVAAQAQTGKAAVYRRWPSKEDLVADALCAGFPELSELPDNGSVREDLIELCIAMRDVMYSPPGIALRSVIHECDDESAARFNALILDGLVRPSRRQIGELVQRGIRRGEVRPGAAGELVGDVIPAIMMYRAKMYDSDWQPAEVVRMIDELMVPLLAMEPGGA